MTEENTNIKYANECTNQKPYNRILVDIIIEGIALCCQLDFDENGKPGEVEIIPVTQCYWLDEKEEPPAPECRQCYPMGCPFNDNKKESELREKYKDYLEATVKKIATDIFKVEAKP